MDDANVNDVDVAASKNGSDEEIKKEEQPEQQATSASDPPESEAALNQGHSAIADEASRLRELQADVRDQDDLERDISRQVHFTGQFSNELRMLTTMLGRQIAHGAG